jgi:hypothetical protein
MLRCILGYWLDHHYKSLTLSLAWFQRAKTAKMLQGGNNTKYFQLVANGKRRKQGFLN